MDNAWFGRLFIKPSTNSMDEWRKSFIKTVWFYHYFAGEWQNFSVHLPVTLSSFLSLFSRLLILMDSFNKMWNVFIDIKKFGRDL